MSQKFEDLSPEAQGYWNQRFDAYSIDGKEAYETLLSEEAQELDSDELIAFLQEKDISHIVPQSQAHELTSDLDNVYLEDASVNRARGAEESTEVEIDTAWEDQIADAQELDSGLGLADLLDGTLVEEVTGVSALIALSLSPKDTATAYLNDEIEREDLALHLAKDALPKVVRYAAVGACLSSGSLLLGAAGTAYLWYKNKPLINKVAKSRPAREAGKLLSRGLAKIPRLI